MMKVAEQVIATWHTHLQTRGLRDGAQVQLYNEQERQFERKWLKTDSGFNFLYMLPENVPVEGAASKLRSYNPFILHAERIMCVHSGDEALQLCEQSGISDESLTEDSVCVIHYDAEPNNDHNTCKTVVLLVPPGERIDVSILACVAAVPLRRAQRENAVRVLQSHLKRLIKCRPIVGTRHALQPPSPPLPPPTLPPPTVSPRTLSRPTPSPPALPLETPGRFLQLANYVTCSLRDPFVLLDSNDAPLVYEVQLDTEPGSAIQQNAQGTSFRDSVMFECATAADLMPGSCHLSVAKLVEAAGLSLGVLERITLELVLEEAGMIKACAGNLFPSNGDHEDHVQRLLLDKSLVDGVWPEEQENDLEDLLAQVSKQQSLISSQLSISTGLEELTSAALGAIWQRLELEAIMAVVCHWTTPESSPRCYEESLEPSLTEDPSDPLAFFPTEQCSSSLTIPRGGPLGACSGLDTRIESMDHVECRASTWVEAADGIIHFLTRRGVGRGQVLSVDAHGGDNHLGQGAIISAHYSTSLPYQEPVRMRYIRSEMIVEDAGSWAKLRGSAIAKLGSKLPISITSSCSSGLQAALCCFYSSHDPRTDELQEVADAVGFSWTEAADELVATLEAADLRIGQVLCVDAYWLPYQSRPAGLAAYFCRSLEGTGPLRVAYKSQTAGSWSKLYDWASEEVRSLGLTRRQVLGISYCVDPASGMIGFLFFEQSACQRTAADLEPTTSLTPEQSVCQRTAADLEPKSSLRQGSNQHMSTSASSESTTSHTLKKALATPDLNQHVLNGASGATEPAPEPVVRPTEAVTNQSLSKSPDASVQQTSSEDIPDDEASDIASEGSQNYKQLSHTPSSMECKKAKSFDSHYSSGGDVGQEREACVPVAQIQPEIDEEPNIPPPICGSSVSLSALATEMVSSLKSMLSIHSSNLQQDFNGKQAGIITRSTPMLSYQLQRDSGGELGFGDTRIPRKSPRDRYDLELEGFEVLQSKNIDLDSLGHQMLVSDIKECKRLCRFRGYGAFVISGGQAFFKQPDARQCRQHLVDEPGCTVYLNALALAGSNPPTSIAGTTKRRCGPMQQGDIGALQMAESRDEVQQNECLHGDETPSPSNRWYATMGCAVSRRDQREQPDCLTQ